MKIAARTHPLTRRASAIPPPARLRAGRLPTASAVAWWATTRGAPTNATAWTTTRGAHANAAGRKGLFRADPPSTSPKNAPKVRWAQPPAATTGSVRGKAAPACLCVLSHARLPARSAPACALHADRQAGRQAGRRPSFSAFFLGEQRTSTCRFTSSAFLPLSSQERGPGG